MMNGHTGSVDGQKQGQTSQVSKSKVKDSSNWFSLPQPVRRVFDSFPLLTIAENRLPQRAIRSRQHHTLYIFSTSENTSRSNLSCNPACLKWQSYLIIKDVPFVVKASNNHASPSGSLPFLLPKRSNSNTQPPPIASGKIQKWYLAQNGATDLSEDASTIYQTLIDQNIREAWLYHLYLDKANFDTVANALYIKTSSSNSLVQILIAAQLRAAAQDELLKRHSVVDRCDIFNAAEKAFRSLSAVLGARKFFASEMKPDLFDASLFAYTHLLLDETLNWSDHSLQDILRKTPNLVQHRDRMLQMCLQS